MPTKKYTFAKLPINGTLEFPATDEKKIRSAVAVWGRKLKRKFSVTKTPDKLIIRRVK